jgi:hypothetical protein
MTNATPVHRQPARTSFTKAARGFDVQPMLQQCRHSVWISKPASAGCLA